MTTLRRTTLALVLMATLFAGTCRLAARGSTDLLLQRSAATLVGTDLPDNIIGTPGNDVIVGRGGDDTIAGRGGMDTICGGTGTDLIHGNGEEDWLYGGDGTATPGDGNDTLLGGTETITWWASGATTSCAARVGSTRPSAAPTMT